MKKALFTLLTLLFICTITWAQMTDQQVLNYVRLEAAKGTSQLEMAMYLQQRGVSPAQLERIKNIHDNESKQVSSDKSIEQQNRERSIDPMERVNAGDFDRISAEMLVTSSDSSQVFGRNIFNNKNLTFAPNSNMPTPSNYVLGPGDEVIIDIWGDAEETLRQTISPEGYIMVSKVGAIFLSGMTVQEANSYLKRRFSQVYAGIGEQSSEFMLTLGQIRTIQINIMGDVLVPGTYVLSSFSSLFHALYRAGGVTNTGSLRSIKLYRNGKLQNTTDLYQYIIDGKFENDVRLADNDVIIVSPYISLVNVSGKVKRPMYYEMKEGETLHDLIRYAGGFEGDAYLEKIRVSRSTGSENSIHTVPQAEFDTFTLKDKDVVTISSGFELFENRVELLGAVKRTGYYEIGKDIHTINELILAADGLRGDAFLNRAVLTRERSDYTTEAISLDIGAIVNGTQPDIQLHKNDILYIPSIHDLKEFGNFVIHGSVARPGEYKYSENTTVEDLIVLAGGLLESASEMRVDISRRIIDSKSVTESDIIAKTFSLAIKDGFIISGEKEFILEPYDQVYIRSSPQYFPQMNVIISGEVLYPGNYPLTKKTERLSEVITRAGGVTKHAYLEGARLIRERSEEELYRSQVAMKLSTQDIKDSIATQNLDIDRYYGIGIELAMALKNPKSDYDLVLREGDRILIPEYENTVKINGAVMYANTVTFKPGQKAGYYIDQAGGYMSNAKKSKAYVIYMNGMVSRINRNDHNMIRPGSEIIVPTKGERRITAQEILGISSTITSMATIIALLVRTLN